MSWNAEIESLIRNQSNMSDFVLIFRHSQNVISADPVSFHTKEVDILLGDPLKAFGDLNCKSMISRSR